MAQVPHPVGDIKLDKTINIMRQYRQNKRHKQTACSILKPTSFVTKVTTGVWRGGKNCL